MKELLARGYAQMFARPNRVAQGVNHTLYHLALRGMGYNNGWRIKDSGEQWFVKNVLRPARPRLCIDVGANIGDYSLSLLAWLPRTKVFAFEPLEEPFARLQEIALIHEGRFFPFDFAIGNTNGQIDIHYGGASEHASVAPDVDRIPYVGNGNKKVRKVEIHTLDNLLVHLSESEKVFRIPEFIKIDVEGFEYEVLQGARGVIDEFKVPWIQIEWNLHQLTRGHTFLAVADLLPAYTPYQLLPRGLRKVDPLRPEANTFCYGNFIFVRNGGA